MKLFVYISRLAVIQFIDLNRFVKTGKLKPLVFIYFRDLRCIYIFIYELNINNFEIHGCTSTI